MQQNIHIDGLSFEPYLEAFEIAEKVKLLAGLINKDYTNKTPVIIGVLNGAALFTADLIRELTIPCELGFLKASSYQGLQSSGEVNISLILSINLKNRDILLVEDIVDTGNTAIKLIELLKTYNPSSIALVSLLFKSQALKHNLQLNYCGFEIPNIFVLGYGLDYNGQGRNLKHIYSLTPNK